MEDTVYSKYCSFGGGMFVKVLIHSTACGHCDVINHGMMRDLDLFWMIQPGDNFQACGDRGHETLPEQEVRSSYFSQLLSDEELFEIALSRILMCKNYKHRTHKTLDFMVL
ncbi:hypothetical protein JOB18_000414 [Solea senegalensis]|uniref:Uncharacterized protein n=1 Tax=Solea senegalensis TaxID=28829 RepID=A0AAV6QCJ3_SOLSE|nr:hypothetical protein JOB18_000414 [Solea senegalensis]